MNFKKVVLLTGASLVAGYYILKEVENFEDNIDYIDRCRNKLISLGHKVADSYTLNLKENNYLMFYFKDNEKNYEAKYNKNKNEIIYVKGE